MTGSWSRMQGGFRCALLCTALGAAACAVQPLDAARVQTVGATAEIHRRSAHAESAAAERALALARETLGSRRPDTLRNMDNLAELHRARGRYGEAEPLFVEALRLRREALGPRHPDTLRSMSNLANLYVSQGRYGEAGPLHLEALRVRIQTLGVRHPDALASTNDLGVLYQRQGRLDMALAAEAFLGMAVRFRSEALGPRHPDTLASMNDLANLYKSQGHMPGYDRARQLYRVVLRLYQEALGPSHPDTLASMNDLADLHIRLANLPGNSTQAEVLTREVLRLGREALGPRHPHVLAATHNLAVLYRFMGRHGEAEPLHRDAVQSAREVLGPTHPTTLSYELNEAVNLAALGRFAGAARRLQDVQTPMLTRLGAEFYTSEAASVRGRLFASQATYQDIVFSLALLPQTDSAAAGLAVSAVLRLKGAQTEEEAHLARIARRSRNPRVREIVAELTGLHGRLAALFHTPDKQADIAARTELAEWLRAPLIERSQASDLHGRIAALYAASKRGEVAALTERLQAQEVALGRVSRDYDLHLQVRDFDPAALHAALAGTPRRAAFSSCASTGHTTSARPNVVRPVGRGCLWARTGCAWSTSGRSWTRRRRSGRCGPMSRARRVGVRRTRCMTDCLGHSRPNSPRSNGSTSPRTAICTSCLSPLCWGRTGGA